MSTNKRTYTEDFQRDAVKLALRSASISSTAKELGIPVGTLHTWLRNASKTTKNDKNTSTFDLTEELHKLRKENARLREEKEILKKAAAYFARDTK
jgi:transposase